MKIENASFLISNTTFKKCPQDGRPEFAFIGRSHVGKSSLINMLTGKKKLAKTSSTLEKHNSSITLLLMMNGIW